MPWRSRPFLGPTKRSQILLAGITLLGYATAAQSLPINFHTTQGDLEYNEIITENFRVYFDARVPHEGRITAHSLEAVRPLLEYWLSIKRSPDRPLRVISSPVTKHASFANFIFDAIELQTQNQNIRDLAWHEYVHTLTYEHYRNFLSPPGTILHILWMPAWFLEGIAEMLSVSIGSDMQSGIERWHALSGDWPSYDRLHSLYLNPAWSERGYAVSGSFVAWMLRELSVRHQHRSPSSPALPSLAAILQEFRRQTMPWKWPLNFFSPMRHTLKTFFKQSGADLYEEYKAQATIYWKLASPYPLLTQSQKYRLTDIPLDHTLAIRKNKLSIMQVGDSALHQYTFDPKTQFATARESTRIDIPSEAINATFIFSQRMRAYVRLQKRVQLTQRNTLMVALPKQDFLPLYSGNAIYSLFENARYFGWLEKSLTSLQICVSTHSKVQQALRTKTLLKPTCKKLGFRAYEAWPIGMQTLWNPRTQSQDTLSIWFRIQETTLAGERYRISVWNGKTGKMQKQAWHLLAKPLSVAFTSSQTWVLTSDRSEYYLARVKRASPCLESVRLSDIATGIWGLPQEQLAIRLYEGNGYYSLRAISPGQMAKYPCPTPDPHSSPLLEGMRILKYRGLPSVSSRQLAARKIPSLEEVILRTHPWKVRHYREQRTQSAKRWESNRKSWQPHPPWQHTAHPRAIRNYFSIYRSLDHKVLTHQKRYSALLKSPHLLAPSPVLSRHFSRTDDIQPYSFRWSSPVLFPWLGPNDIHGPQLGIITYPFVDDLQNHRLEGTFLIGLSQYPSAQLTYYNTRFAVPITVRAFKQLTYNGYVPNTRSSQGDIIKGGTIYLDETGGNISINDGMWLVPRSLRLRYTLSWQSSQLRHQTGPRPQAWQGQNEGIRHQPSLAVWLTKSLPWRSSLTFFSGFTIAPEAFNQDYDYYKTHYAITWSKGLFQQSHISWNATWQQTRGDRPMFLKEYYTPTPAFILGSGGTAQNFQFPILGEKSLFQTIQFGDTLFKTKATFKTPMISDVDTQIWILYAKSLDSTTSIQWGGPWGGPWGGQSDEFPAKELQPESFLLSYFTALDLTLVNKGVSFYTGMAVGRLHTKPFETTPGDYLTERGLDFALRLGFTALF